MDFGCKGKPIIKMLEDIKIKVMDRLKDLAVHGEKWTENFCPYAMELYNDFKIIARDCHVQANGDLGYEVVEGIDRHVVSLASKKCTCRTWDLTGIPCPHAIKAFQHDKQEPEDEIHQWYSKDTYILLYQHKIQPVRGEKFWKVHPSHAMEPPGIHKMLQRREEVLQDVPLSVPQPSEESVFMPTHGFSASSSQQISQPTDEVVGPSNKKRKAKDKLVAPSKRGDENGVSIPTNMPYSPRKMTWKGKSCVTSSQMATEKEKRISKLKTKR
ncbi:putative DNA-directed RNA polymerase I subunit rpa1-like, partial [Capsicum annuum]